MGAKLVSEVMHAGLVACWFNETLSEVARRMCEDNIHAIFVMNNDGRVAGILSQTDLAEAYVQGDWQDLVADDIMTDSVVSVTGETPLDIAVGLMLCQNIHRVLVVQEGNRFNRPIGVLSLSDVVGEMAGASILSNKFDMELAE